MGSVRTSSWPKFANHGGIVCAGCGRPSDSGVLAPFPTKPPSHCKQHPATTIHNLLAQGHGCCIASTPTTITPLFLRHLLRLGASRWMTLLNSANHHAVNLIIGGCFLATHPCEAVKTMEMLKTKPPTISDAVLCTKSKSKILLPHYHQPPNLSFSPSRNQKMLVINTTLKTNAKQWTRSCALCDDPFKPSCASGSLFLIPPRTPFCAHFLTN